MAKDKPEPRQREFGDGEKVVVLPDPDPAVAETVDPPSGIEVATGLADAVRKAGARNDHADALAFARTVTLPPERMGQADNGNDACAFIRNEWGADWTSPPRMLSIVENLPQIGKMAQRVALAMPAHLVIPFSPTVYAGMERELRLAGVLPPLVADLTGFPLAVGILRRWANHPWDLARGMILADSLDEADRPDLAGAVREWVGKLPSIPEGARGHVFSPDVPWSTMTRTQRRVAVNGARSVLIEAFGDFTKKARAPEPHVTCGPPF